MGFAITTVLAAQALDTCSPEQKSQMLETLAPVRMHSNTLFAGFLDDMVSHLGAGLPARLFTQGCAPHPDNPGDLDPAGCLRLADAIDHRSDVWLHAAMRAGTPDDAEQDNTAAIAFVRELAILARIAAGQDGLRIS